MSDIDEPKITRESASVINIWNDRLLVLIRKKWESEGTPFILPGGGIEKGESPVRAAAREFCEETGMIIGLKELEDFDQFETKWTGKLWFFKLRTPARPQMIGFHMANSIFYVKFSGFIWMDLKNKDLLTKLKPLCMHGLQQLIEKYWLV